MTDNTEYQDPVDTLVVGGGLAGLVAATTAAQRGHGVVLVDPRTLGGRARCDQRGDYTFNRGPRALYLGGPARPILESLGVDTTAGASPTVPGAQGRLDGVLHLLPQGPGSLLRTSLLGRREKLRFARLLAGLPKIEAASLAGTSFGDFLDDQRLSPTGADVVRMIARVATYSGDPDQVDAEAVVTNIQLALGEGVRYLDGGFQALVDGLRAAAQRAGVEVRSVGAATVHPAGGSDDRPSVTTIDGQVIHAASVVVAAGSPAAAAGLLGEPVKRAEGLTAPVTAACLELGLRRPPRHRVLFGVGEPLYLSTHCPPARLAPEGHAVVHAMRNHRADETLDPGEQRAWLRAAAAQAGVADDDVVEERFLAEMVVSGGLPTAAGGGLAGRPPVADPSRPGVLLAGDWVGPEGLLADAAVASGAEAGRRASANAGAMVVA